MLRLAHELRDLQAAIEELGSEMRSGRVEGAEDARRKAGRGGNVAGGGGGGEEVADWKLLLDGELIDAGG